MRRATAPTSCLRPVARGAARRCSRRGTWRSARRRR
jgi:hypothetical protein